MKTLILALSILVSAQAFAVGETCEIDASLAVATLDNKIYHEETLEAFQDRFYYDQTKIANMFGMSKQKSTSTRGDMTPADCFKSAVYVARHFMPEVRMTATEMLLAGMKSRPLGYFVPRTQTMKILSFAAWKYTNAAGTVVRGKVDYHTKDFPTFHAGDVRCYLGSRCWVDGE